MLTNSPKQVIKILRIQQQKVTKCPLGGCTNVLIRMKNETSKGKRAYEMVADVKGEWKGEGWGEVDGEC